MDKNISQLVTGSIFDSSLGLIGDPISGFLAQTSYRAMKDYFSQGLSINTGSLLLTSSFNTYTASNSVTVANVYASQSNYTQLSLFGQYTASIASQIGQYETTASFTAFSSSVATSFHGITGSSSQVLNFIVGDGQSFTPASGSTVFSSSIIVGKSVLQFSQESTPLAPISRSVAWYSVTSSIGKLNLNNSTFVPDAWYQIIYT